MNTTGSRSLSLLTAGLVSVLLVSAPLFAEQLRPTQRTSDTKGAIELNTQVPTQFGPWREDKSIVPVLPDPALQATLDATYSQVLARTYINLRGERVMLSIAYGNDQNSESTAVHRPEFCYRAQGFDVQVGAISPLDLPGRQLNIQRLVGRMGPRVEPISYWITLNETASLPGMHRKIQQIKYGLQGLIADGMVLRVSTLGMDIDRAYALQEQFLRDLHQSLPASTRSRYFGH